MKLATGLDEMPGRRGIPEVNWADGVLSGSLLVREKNRGDKKERREGREGKERWDGGTDLDSHPSWNRRDGEASLRRRLTNALPKNLVVNEYQFYHAYIGFTSP